MTRDMNPTLVSSKQPMKQSQVLEEARGRDPQPPGRPQAGEVHQLDARRVAPEHEDEELGEEAEEEDRGAERAARRGEEAIPVLHVHARPASVVVCL